MEVIAAGRIDTRPLVTLDALTLSAFDSQRIGNACEGSAVRVPQFASAPTISDVDADADRVPRQAP